MDRSDDHGWQVWKSGLMFKVVRKPLFCPRDGSTLVILMDGQQPPQSSQITEFDISLGGGSVAHITDTVRASVGREKEKGRGEID